MEQQSNSRMICIQPFPHHWIDSSAHWTMPSSGPNTTDPTDDYQADWDVDPMVREKRHRSTPPALQSHGNEDYNNYDFPEICKTISDTQFNYPRFNTSKPPKERQPSDATSYPGLFSENDPLSMESDLTPEPPTHVDLVEDASNTLSFLVIDYLATQILHQWTNRMRTRANEDPETAFRYHGAHQGNKRNRSTRQSKSQDVPSQYFSNTPNHDEEDEEDARGRRLKRHRADSRSTSVKCEPAVRLLACPYSKYDGQRYSDRNHREMEYRGCSSAYITTIPRLKQHLYRRHRKPDHYCGRCYSEFLDRDDLDDHTRQADQCLVGAPRWTEKMSERQLLSIRQRNPGRTEEEKWFSIYAVLFPDSIAPRSCYVDENLEDHVRDFLDFFRREARPILEDGLVSAGVAQTGAHLTQAMDIVLENTVDRFMALLTETQAADGVVQSHLENQNTALHTAQLVAIDDTLSVSDAHQGGNAPTDLQDLDYDAPPPLVTFDSMDTDDAPQTPTDAVCHVQPSESFDNQDSQFSPVTTAMTTDTVATACAPANSENTSTYQLTIPTQPPDFGYFNLDHHSLALSNLNDALSHDNAQNWLAVSDVSTDFQLDFGLQSPVGPVAV